MMKTFKLIIFLLLPICCAVINTCNNQENETKISSGNVPEAISDQYPRVVYFRKAENPHRYSDYENWEETFDNFGGFIGQLLPYQLSDHVLGEIDRNPEYFARFKKENPNQIILMHLNGNAQDPRNLPVDYFAGHWLYYEGTKAISDIPADAANTTINVEDASLFHTNVGFTSDRDEDIGICALDENGKPDWNYSEQVRLTKVDTVNNTITVMRGLYGTFPREFKKGKAYLASHVWNGPWNKRTRMVWLYNYSTGCPVDKLGRNCSDMVVKYLSEAISDEGLAHSVDGFAFDVVYNAPSCSYRNSKGRLPDFDADGVGDDFETDTRYITGVTNFFKDLRKAVGDDVIITSDGQGVNNQRAFNILNGMESEGWPSGADPGMNDWSGGLNRLLFWSENSHPPVMNFTNFKYYRNVDLDNIKPAHARVVLAVTMFTNSFYAINLTPDQIFNYSQQVDNLGNQKIEVWDELVKGAENEKQWLGKPLEPMKHYVRLEKAAVENLFNIPLSSIREMISGEDLLITNDNNSIKLQSTGSEIRFTIKGIPLKHKDLSLFIKAKADPMRELPEEFARLMIVTTGEKKLPLPGRLTHHINEINRFMSFINPKEFMSGFYFSNISEETTDIEILIESEEPVWITGIEAYSHPDIVYRRFENGLVIANPSEKAFTLNMSDLSGNMKYQRLQATKNQDNKVNNGEVVVETLTINGKDAIFLKKQ